MKVTTYWVSASGPGMVDAPNELLTILLAVPVKDRNCACDPIVGCVLYCVLPGGKFLWGMSKWLLKFKTDDLHNCWQVDWCPMSGCYRSSHIKLRRGDSWLPTANSCRCFISDSLFTMHILTWCMMIYQNSLLLIHVLAGGWVLLLF